MGAVERVAVMRILIALLLAAGLSPAATFYVANAGSDAANGTSTSTPWQTVAKVNALTCSGSDQVFFNRGDTWREMLTLPCSGMTIGAYGSGSQPIVTGANLATWTQGSGVSAQETCTTPCTFDSGMETGGSTFTDWTSVSQTGMTVTQATDQFAHGTHSAKMTGNGTDNQGGLIKNISAPVAGTPMYFRMYVYVPSGALKANDNFIFFSFPAFGNINAGLYTDGSGNVSNIQLYANTCAPCGASISFPMNTWNYIDIEILRGTTTSNGGGQVWVNGVSAGSNFTGDTTGASAITSFQVGNNSFSHGQVASGSIYFDDVRVSTSGPIGAFSGGVPTTVWSTSQTTNPYFPTFSSQVGIVKPSIGALVSANQWYWDGSTTLYVYSASNPASTVEIPARDYAVSSSAGVNNVSVENLDMRGALVDGFYCSTPNATGCSHIILDSDTVELNYSDGIQFLSGTGDFSTNGLLRNSVLKNNGSSGIKLNGYWNTWTIDGNQSFGNCQAYNAAFTTQENTYCGGIYVYTVAGTDGGGSQIENNTVYNNGVSGQAGSYGIGIWTDTTTGVTIHNNAVYGNLSNGIFMEKTVNGVARNNLVYNSGTDQYQAGLRLAAGQGFSSTNNRVFNNTIVGGWWAIGMTFEDTNGSMRGNSISDNIAVNATVGQQALYVDPNASNNTTYSSGNTFDHNNFGTAASSFLCFGSSCQNTYSAFDTAYGSSSHSITSDPGFVNAGAANYALTVTSPDRNAGIRVYGAGQQVSELIPDIGAYEYVPGKLGTLSTSQLGNRYKSATQP